MSSETFTEPAFPSIHTGWMDCTLPSVKSDTPFYLPKRLLMVWQARSDLKKAFPLKTLSGRMGLLHWWFGHGVNEYPALNFSVSEQNQLFALNPEDSLVESVVPLFLKVIFSCRQDLQQIYDVTCVQGRMALVNWWLSPGRTEYTYISSLLGESMGAQEFYAALGVFRFESTKQESDLFCVDKMGAYAAGGINVSGFATGVMGLGEDARMISHALKSAEVPFSVYDVPLKIHEREAVPSLESYLVKEPVYQANLICLPGTVTYELLLKVGFGYFNHRFNIGVWLWELPHWPTQFMSYFHLVHELWAFSHYIEKMFLESAPVPVTYMPIVVELPHFLPCTRTDFGLPAEPFLFLVMFDGQSFLARKNPLAAVRAFLQAFPKHNDSVRLLVKARDLGGEHHPDWQALCRYADQDDRIIIMNKTLSREKTIALIDCCDAYVSLHRSEGFGRILAEAMLLNKPVIATNYSGNTDFSTPETAFLVDGPIVPLKKDEYTVWKGQSWCDPDIAHAAEQMRLCFEDGKLRKQIASAGQAYIQTHYAASVAGVQYKKRLQALGIIA